MGSKTTAFFMKTTSTHLGLVQINPVTYEVTIATTGTPLVPAAITITAFESGANGKTILFAATVPRWLKVGMTVLVAGETANLKINRTHRVSFIDSGLTYFEVEANWLTKVIPNAAVTGTVTATASFHAQRAIIQNVSGVTVTLQPQAGTAFGYQPTIATGSEKELVAPQGGKFDMADWYGRVAAATQVVKILLF